MAGPEEEDEEEENAENRVTAAEDPRGRRGSMTEGTEVTVSNGSHRCLFFPQMGGGAAGVSRKVCPPSSCTLFRQYKILSSRKQCCCFLLMPTIPDIWHEPCSPDRCASLPVVGHGSPQPL